MVKTQQHINNVRENIELEKEIRQKEYSVGRSDNFQTSFNWVNNIERERANLPRKEPPTTRIISFLRVS